MPARTPDGRLVAEPQLCRNPQEEAVLSSSNLDPLDEILLRKFSGGFRSIIHLVFLTRGHWSYIRLVVFVFDSSCTPGLATSCPRTDRRQLARRVALWRTWHWRRTRSGATWLGVVPGCVQQDDELDSRTEVAGRTVFSVESRHRNSRPETALTSRHQFLPSPRRVENP